MRQTLACILGAATLAVVGCGDAETSRQPDAKPASAKTAGDPKVDPDATTITYEGEDGETALELLEEHGYDVEVETSSLGDYVTAIGEVEVTKSEYWSYEVDGRMPNVGADQYETKDGQQVEWRYGS